jgi:arginase
MGRGPLHLAENGAAGRLREGGRMVRETVIEARHDFRAEPATSFELARSTALAIRSATARGSFPLVLAGNCMASLGVLAGLGTEGTGVVWLDAHADLNTPETTVSGFLDGMALATVAGRCWRALAATVDGYAGIPEERVLLVGARDLDEAEERILDASRIMWVGAEQVRQSGPSGALAGRLEALRGRVQRVYLHVDLDVHDPAEGRANAFAAPGGLTAAEVRHAVRAVAGHLPIAAAAITAYDPDADADGRMLKTGLELIEVIADLAAGE